MVLVEKWCRMEDAKFVQKATVKVDAKNLKANRNILCIDTQIKKRLTSFVTTKGILIAHALMFTLTGCKWMMTRWMVRLVVAESKTEYLYFVYVPLQRARKPLTLNRSNKSYSGIVLSFRLLPYFRMWCKLLKWNKVIVSKNVNLIFQETSAFR